MSNEVFESNAGNIRTEFKTLRQGKRTENVNHKMLDDGNS